MADALPVVGPGHHEALHKANCANVFGVTFGGFSKVRTLNPYATVFGAKGLLLALFLMSPFRAAHCTQANV